MSQCHDPYSSGPYRSGPTVGAEGGQCHDPGGVDGNWYGELVLVGSVREWARAHAPGDVRTEDAAVAAALDAFVSGASIPEAVAVAKRRVASRLRHPSHA